MANEGIRSYAKANNVPLWKLAKYLHISEATMTRKLRFPLDEAETQKMISAIDNAKKEGE